MLPVKLMSSCLPRISNNEKMIHRHDRLHVFLVPILWSNQDRYSQKKNVSAVMWQHGSALGSALFHGQMYNVKGMESSIRTPREELRQRWVTKRLAGVHQL